jgi:DNA-nicking Smr family endonuclease
MSAQDRELWLMSMKDVMPLNKPSHQVPVCSQFTTVEKLRVSPGDIMCVNQIRHRWDLHGMTVQQAHVLVMHQIDQLHEQVKYVTFITGKSGQISKEFPHWVSAISYVRACEILNQGGAYRVWFHRKKGTTA